MDRLIYTAMTGASQTVGRQAAIAQNLANVSSTGYRAEEHRLRAVQLTSANKTPTAPLPTRSFVVDASVYSDYSPGPLMNTGRQLDVAIQGKGWIAVTAADGTEAYTRNGNLNVDANGTLQTMSGLSVVGDGGPISVPPDQKIEIGRDGTISIVPQTGAQTTSSIGRIKLVNPPEADLVRGPDGLFRTADGSPAPLDETVKVSNSFLEGSNVNAVEQMVNMISLARQFEMQVKAVQTAEENDKAATQVLSNL